VLSFPSKLKRVTKDVRDSWWTDKKIAQTFNSLKFLEKNRLLKMHQNLQTLFGRILKKDQNKWREIHSLPGFIFQFSFSQLFVCLLIWKSGMECFNYNILSELIVKESMLCLFHLIWEVRMQWKIFWRAIKRMMIFSLICIEKLR